MKLIIQVPCLNEEETLELVINDIPKEIPGISSIETLVIDDGSTDNTVKIAKNLGVTHIIKNNSNKGLAYSFKKGLEYSLDQGADILINTDGDNQYPSNYISELVKPIISDEADIVVGDRQTSKVKHFTALKKGLQWLGTKVTQYLSGDSDLKDAVSGFRAYNKDAMLELNITSNFSYILDTTVQSSNKKLKTVTIPISTNPPTRPSRLFNNMFEHIYKSGKQILRIYALYKPLKVFFTIAFFLFITGIIPIIRFLIFFFSGDGDGHIQSLIIGGIILSMSINFFALGVIGDLMSKNRMLTEQALKYIKEIKNKDRT